MSEAIAAVATGVEHGEILVAISPTGARVVMGARGSLARDLAGAAGSRPTLAPAWMDPAFGLCGAGLWVWCGDLAPAGDRWRCWRDQLAAGTVRRAVIGDFGRFGIATPMPRIEEVTS